MAVFDPLSRYSADSTAYQAINLNPGDPGVVTVSGLSSVDNGSVAINLGSNVFRFYGTNFTGNDQLYISSNGLITFGNGTDDPTNNELIGPGYRIAPLWDDWVTNRNGSPDDLVLYQFQDLNSDGVADQLVIEWNGVYNLAVPENDSATFQVILALNTGATNGDIVFNYVDLAVDGDSGDSNYNDGGSATIGIQSGQYDNYYIPLRIGYNGDSSLPIGSGTAIRITSLPNPVSPTPTLVKDINAVSDDSSPSELTVFNGALYFFGNNGRSGYELLKTDALGNTTLVKDIRTGGNGSEPKLLTVVGSSLYFFASDDTNGYGLWKSDGTEAGTTLVTPVSGNTHYYNGPATVAASGGKFFFQGYDDTNGIELWVSNGTAAGTTRISNIESGTGWSNPSNLTDVNGTLYFTAETTTGGRELYKSNGTSAGTVLVRAIASGTPSSDPRELINLNGTLYFTANDGTSGRELWKSDGTSATTVTVRNINTNAGIGSDPRNLTILGTNLYFFANSGGGYQLWKSNGTSAGTVRVSTTIFNADYWSNFSFNLFNLNGTLYFSHQGSTTTELWSSNGTTVTKVADLPTYYGFISDFTNVNGTLYFSYGYDTATGKELWKSDGTAAGTQLVKDVVPGGGASNPRELTAFNNQLHFVASSDDYYNYGELWKSDGTEAGTVSLDANPTTLGADISEPLLFNGQLYFAANNGGQGRELWTSDGTAAGTQLIKDIQAGGVFSDSSPEHFAITGGKLYFTAYDGTNSHGLWKSDGTEAGTELVRGGLGVWLTYNNNLAVVGDRLFFRNNDENGIELWTSDGTTAGTQMVKNIGPDGSNSEPGIWDGAAIGNTLFFTAYDPTNGRELWKTDGTEAGTVLVRNIAPADNGSNPDHLIAYNGAIYFAASDPTYGRELWKTDGTTTTRLKNIYPGSGGSDPGNFTVFQGSLYFSAYDGTFGWELWKTNGTSAGTLRVTNHPDFWAGLGNFTVANNTLFFTRYDQLWKSDGTDAGTSRVTDLGLYADLNHLTNVNGILYFSAYDPTYGRELWRSDGSSEGTYRVTDLNPYGDANPTNLIYDASRNKLFFTANNGLNGNQELFSLDISNAPTDLSLSATSLNENVAANTVVGTLSSTDPDSGNTFTYSLVTGTGNGDNGAFTIDGNQLRINSSPNFEAKSSYSIRVRTTDQSGLSVEKTLTIGVNNLNEAPTDLSLSGPGNVNENTAPAFVLGSLSSIDPDSTTPQTFTYSLVTGTGDGDNNAFSIIGGQLVLNAPADFETKPSYSIRVRTTDQGGLSFDKVLTIGVNNVNDAPTDLSLSATSVNENVAANTVIGNFSTTDQDSGNTFTYSLVTGTGGTDNGSFNILGNQLRINSSPNFEVKNNFSIRVRTTDQSGAFFDKVVAITINNVNETPTNISLSATSVNENIAAGSVVGTLTSTDPDSSLTPQTFTYLLVTGTGSTDNGAFEIRENQLVLRAAPDFEAKSSYSIRVQTRDQGNRTFAKVFTITVTNQPDAPTDLALSATSLSENVAANTVVGTFSSTDQDAGSTFTYSLVTGDGSTDNSSFTIVGNQLQINSIPDFEAKPSYSIRVRTTDQSGLSFEKALTVGVTNLNEAPTDLALSAASINENVGPAAVVGTLTSIDPDSTTPQTFTYSLVTGTGDGDNNAFSIIGGQLVLNAPADFETKPSYSIRVRTTDQGGLFLEKALTVGVTNVNEAPTDLALSATSLNENVAANTVVGTFSSTDQDSGNTFTYSLVTGTGATDNGAFTIVGNQLRINSRPNFEVKNNFSIRVRTTDQSGAFFDKVVAITINNLNERPTNITLTANTVNENVAPMTVIGNLGAVDPDSSLTPQTFAYRLVSGAGSTDNNAFEIQGNQLVLKASPNFEAKSAYSIRLEVKDQGNLAFTKAFTIGVNNLNEAPTDLALSASVVNENVAPNTVIGNFSSTDQDASNTFTYSLVTGTGSTDNGAFTIDGNQLRINSSPDFETKSSYDIRLRTTDQGGLFFEKALTIAVNDLDNVVEGTDGNDIFTATQELDDIQGLAGNDTFNVSIAFLNGGDSFDAGDGVDRVNFSGGSATQVLTLDLREENQLLSITNATIPGTLPVFSGFEEVSLASFSGQGVLTGNDSDNTLIGSARKDSLTGGGGVDIFGINALTHSLLATFDVITDYASQDRIDAPGTIPATPTTPITITSSSGNATSLSSSAIAAVLSSAAFPANSARAFTVTGQTGTFIALNNASAGFSSSADAIIHLSNYTIGVDNPVTII